MAVTKLKTAKTSHLWDSWVSEKSMDVKKTAQDSKTAILRSQALVKKAKEVMTEMVVARERRKRTCH
ncbi:MAG TPA: hypothetical protein VFB79_08045 [Candidatus Angelobacter sp.]|nr:hypothetical protein [Candidatus Angelobacter sp.]